ncbi:putative arabinose-binding protein [subsurface metagenome]
MIRKLVKCTFLVTIFSVFMILGNAVGGAAAQKKITLDFWNTFSLAEIKLLHEYFNEYETLHPNITITAYEIPHGQRETKVPVAVMTGQTPDILRADYPYQYSLAKMGELLALDDYLKGWEGLEDIYPIMWEDVTYKDRIYAIPQDGFRTVLYYNKDHFDEAGIKEAPDTWDELVTIGQKLTKDTDGDGKIDQYGFGLHGKGNDAVSDFMAFLFQAGGAFFRDELSPEKSDGIYTPEDIVVNNEAGKTAIQFFVDLVKKYKISPPGAASHGYGEVNDAFKGGVGSMYLCGSWNIANYEVEVPHLNYGMAVLPAGPAGYAVPYHACFYEIFKDTKYPKETVDLLKWLVSKEKILRWSKELKHMPVRTSVFANPLFDKPVFKAYKDSVPYQTRQHPKTGRWGAINKATYTHLAKVLLEEETPEQALDKIAEEIKKTIE